MTLTEKKANAKSAYKDAKEKYLETMSKQDWIAFCNAKNLYDAWCYPVRFSGLILKPPPIN